MKKLLIFLLLACTVLAGCGEPDFVSTMLVANDSALQEPLTLAKDEFERIFAHLDDLRIVGANTAVRSDDADTVVVEIAYTSASGKGAYGFLCGTDENGDYYIVSHGENVTVKMLED